MGVHRSKRPKLPAQPPRASSGGDGMLGSKTQPVRKVIMELIRHPFAPPFATPVDPSLYPEYYTKVTPELFYSLRPTRLAHSRPTPLAAPHSVRQSCASLSLC